VSDSKQTVGKLLFFLVIGLLCAIAGLYLSGYVTQIMLKVPTAGLKWNTWIQYFQVIDAPQYLAYAKKIKIGGLIGFGLPFIVWAGMLILVFMPKRQTLHGDARFASGGDLAGKDMFKPHKNGIVIGKFGGKIIRLGGQQFVILAAPTRSGKGVGVVIPNLLDYQESMVVLDAPASGMRYTSSTRSPKTAVATAGTH
jgi:type IV secretion system protein VirD4